MKKSKILAPALAVLTFSTAAAVTGTVAWYFAQRAVSVKATVTSFNPEAGLKVTLTAGVGTKEVTKPTGTGVEAPTNAEIVHELIRDGSVSLGNEKVYAGIRNRQGNALTGFEEIDGAAATEADLLAGKTASNQKYFYATKFTAKFELTKQDSNTQYALYYDNSLLTVNSGSLVQESLRIGIKTADSWFVIAPFRSEAAVLSTDDPSTPDVTEPTVTGMPYIKGTSLDDAKGDYDAENKILYGYQTQIIEDDPDTDENEYAVSVVDAAPAENLVNGNTPLAGEVDADDAAGILGYMGLIKKAENITATVYTWFEGEDPASLAQNVDNAATSTALGFQILEVNE